LNQDPVSAGCVRAIEVQGDQVSVQLQLGYAAGLFKSGWAQMLQMAIEGLDGVRAAKVDIQCVIAPHKAQAQIPGLANVKNVVAVASGKGGVGKSTTAANLALALAREGARVGILDADIYGPNIPTLMGVNELPPPEGEKMVPALAHGVRVMSMGFLIDENTPVIWRGPMIMKTIQQFVQNVKWGDLDILLVDLPQLDEKGRRTTKWYIGTRNFSSVLRYNRSYFYAAAVAMLANRIAGIDEP
jgi:ATP-binding protein involved in chromosome partitioning